MRLEGSGELSDGTTYRRELTISETCEAGGSSREVYEDRVEIGGQVCELRGERRDGEVTWEIVQVR